MVDADRLRIAGDIGKGHRAGIKVDHVAGVDRGLVVTDDRHAGEACPAAIDHPAVIDRGLCHTLMTGQHQQLACPKNRCAPVLRQAHRVDAQRGRVDGQIRISGRAIAQGFRIDRVRAPDFSIDDRIDVVPQLVNYCRSKHHRSEAQHADAGFDVNRPGDLRAGYFSVDTSRCGNHSGITSGADLQATRAQRGDRHTETDRVDVPRSTSADHRGHNLDCRRPGRPRRKTHLSAGRNATVGDKISAGITAIEHHVMCLIRRPGKVQAQAFERRCADRHRNSHPGRNDGRHRTDSSLIDQRR